MANADYTSMVEVTDLHKRYGSGAAATTALAGVSFRVARGAFVSLMGPSGSGKTTLLNLVAGLDVPDRGRIVVAGKELGQLRDHELADLRLQTIGFVFQAFNLIAWQTVAENVGWPLRFSGVSRRDVRAAVARALERTGVAGRGGRYPGELSGGEQQRVAIARAIATDPQLLVVDEPTGNLDSLTGRLILDLLRALNTEQGVTVLMVTHSTFAAGYGDRTLELQDGKIVRDVSTPALRAVVGKDDAT